MAAVGSGGRVALQLLLGQLALKGGKAPSHSANLRVGSGGV